jgi:osmotically-inducible protein OsmY
MSNVFQKTLIVSGLALGLGIASAQQVDNTKMNQRDGDPSHPTADQAKNNQTDLDIMKRIRKSVVADKTLSSYGHNVKIISQNGKVTLRGPVHTDEEKRNIEAKAVAVAGAQNVTDMLDVKGDK